MKRFRKIFLCASLCTAVTDLTVAVLCGAVCEEKKRKDAFFPEFFPSFSLSLLSLRIQAVLEEMGSMESELGMLRERAHSLWEGQAAGKGFVHRVCQLAARYLALSNRTKVRS